jgi:CBS-domain-containing membrane protein
MKPKTPETRTLPIKRRIVLGEDDPTEHLEVFCPAQEATVPAWRCADCGFLKAFPREPARPNATLACAPPGIDANMAARASHKIDIAEAAARVPLGEFVDRRVVCVKPTTSVEHLRALMAETGHESFPVVDASWKPLGMISKSDLVREQVDEDAEVASLMSPLVFSLPEDARLTHAISLLAAEGVHQIPVLTAEGAIVGVVTAVECLRWVARQMGYE